ncbi:MAG: LysR family transcriptional regulator [Bdellovibrionota bacterium]
MFLKDLADYSIQSLRIFAYVSSMGSVAEAAEALKLSQPAVSLQISNLERQLGFSLFERSGRRNVLTGRGQDLYQKLLPLLERLEILMVDVREEENLTKPKLFLSSVEGVGEFWLLNRFKDFRSKNPESRLFLEVQDNDIIIERLLTGRADLVITTKKIEHPGTVSELLMEEKLVPVGRKKDIEALKTIIEKAKDGERFWEKISWIGYGDSFSTETWALRWLEQMGTVIDRRFKYRHQVNSYVVIRRLLIDAMGICVAPLHTVEDLIESGELSSLESKKFPALGNKLYISYRQQALSRIGIEFRDWIKDAARSYEKN